MKLELISLKLKNFKGVKELGISPNGKNIKIEGPNGSGKTTTFDAFWWLLFGKDSGGNTTFNVKTLDLNNKVISGLDHQVEGILNVDGKQVKFTRTLKEKWTKARGEAHKTFTGNVTTYEIDDIPVKEKDYKEKVNNIVNEDMFKLLTNPDHFPSLHWKAQREMILSTIEKIKEDDVYLANPELIGLRGKLTDGIDNFMARTKASIKKLNDSLKYIPVRIDECFSKIIKIDFEKLEQQQKAVEKEIEGIESSLEDTNKKNQVVLDLQAEIFKKKSEYQAAKQNAQGQAMNPKYELEREIQELNYKLQNDNFMIKDLTTKKEYKEGQIKDKEAYKIALKDDYAVCRDRKFEFKDNYYESVKDKEFVFDETDAACKLCGTEFEIEKIEEIKAKALNTHNSVKEKALENYTKGKEEALERFNSDKAADLTDINVKGQANNKVIEVLQEEINAIENNINEYVASIKSQEEKLEEKQQLLADFKPQEVIFLGEEELKKAIEDKEKELEQTSSIDNSELKNRRTELRADLEQIKQQLYQREVNKQNQDRIADLEGEASELSISISNLEKEQMLGEKYIKAEVSLLENSINNMFSNVKFKMFKEQINGGLEEVFEILIDGVPYKDLNTASKVNAGIMVIEGLSKHYGISAPVWVDNAERVNEIVKINGQMITLRVTGHEIFNVKVKK